MVNTVQAYRNLQQALAGRTLAAAQKNAAAGNDTLAQTLGQSATDSTDPAAADPSQQDYLSLSGAAADQSTQDATTDSTDNSLGAIVEGFISQRQTYNFTIPGVGGMTSPISVTWEVQKAYHVIQFVPQGQSIDQQA